MILPVFSFCVSRYYIIGKQCLWGPEMIFPRNIIQISQAEFRLMGQHPHTPSTETEFLAVYRNPQFMESVSAGKLRVTYMLSVKNNVSRQKGEISNRISPTMRGGRRK